MRIYYRLCSRKNIRKLMMIGYNKLHTELVNKLGLIYRRYAIIYRDNKTCSFFAYLSDGVLVKSVAFFSCRYVIVDICTQSFKMRIQHYSSGHAVAVIISIYGYLCVAVYSVFDSLNRFIHILYQKRIG